MSKTVDQVILAITAWLEPRDEDRLRADLRGWDEDDWMLARRVAFMHGVSPSLHQNLSAAPSLYRAFPMGFKEYLESQTALNAARMQRAHNELAAILSAANCKGIEVMPIKGSLLSTLGQTDPKLRTMADIDLLIRPADRLAMAELLEQRGYEREQPKELYPHHDHFNHKQDQVVSWEGEHPQNPLPVEIHTHMRRILWGDVLTPDFTRILWDRASPGKILGQPAWIPGDEAHYAYLCLHALVHLLVCKGRLAQWLDLARLASGIPDFSRLPYGGLLYPLVRLAARALPAAFAGVDLHPMAALSRPWVRNWAETIPLNYCCGLLNQHTPQHPAWIADRWNYWRPTPIRLAATHPETPLPAAYLVYLGTVILHIVKRGRYLLRKKQP